MYNSEYEQVTRELENHYESRLRQLRRQSAAHDEKYSLTRLLNGMREDRINYAAPYEDSVSRKISEEIGREPRPGFRFVPVTKRDLTVASSSGGGYLVSDEVAPGDVFTGAMRATSVINQMAISRLQLTGSGTFPRTSGDISSYWLQDEGTAITESNFTFNVGAVTPKTVGAYCEVTDNFLKQTTPAAPNFILGEMGRATSTEVDNKCINGSGGQGQIIGILNSGISSVTGTNLTWSLTCDGIKSVEDANGLVAPERSGWVISPDVAKVMRTREKASGSGFILNDSGIAGFKTLVSNSVPAGTAIFSDWSGALLVEWGVLEIGVDPYGISSALFKNRLVGLRALWSCDLVLLRPASFVKIVSIT